MDQRRDRLRGKTGRMTEWRDGSTNNVRDEKSRAMQEVKQGTLCIKKMV